MSKGTRFWGFLGSRGRGIIGGISFIPLNVASFSGLNLGHGVPMRCFYYTQSLLQIRGANREIESWIRGVDPQALFIPRAQVTPVWPEQTLCWVLLGWTSWCVPCCLVLLFFWVWSILGLGRFV
jgi:hypothetical protein